MSSYFHVFKRKKLFNSSHNLIFALPNRRGTSCNSLFVNLKDF